MTNKIENEIQVLMSIQQFLPNFEIYKRGVLFDLEQELINENITLGQYKKYVEQISSVSLEKIDLTSTYMHKELQNYKIKIDVENILKVRTYLDNMYSKFTKKDDVTDDKELAKTLLLKLIKKLQENDMNSANNLFFSFCCFIRCHDLDTLNNLNNKAVAIVFQEINRKSIEFLKDSNIKMLDAFGIPKNNDVSCALIAHTVNNILTFKDYEKSLNATVTLIKKIDGMSSISLKDLEQVEKLLKMFFYIEDDLEEIFLMVEMLEKYSDYTIYEIIGSRVINYVLEFISDYFSIFDDFSCYDFVVQNQLYFSNASNQETIKQTKLKIKNLLEKFQLKDYDSITD